METLSHKEVRVLGALIEKEVSTPDYYPLSMNALVNACNQKSNRDPVVKFDENLVAETLDSLRHKKYAVKVISGDSRVPKYAQTFTRDMMLTEQEISVLCELLLRGPQTPGELRSRTHRLYDFEGLDEVEAALDSLMNREDAPMVMCLPVQPGRKEHRFCHLLSGEPSLEESQAESISMPSDHPSSDRLEHLVQEVESLTERLESLEAELAAFKRQFE